ncbi:MAG: hypothetical protein QM708_12995 [Propioniciclava sp.]|uniref:hypothetical protein n=1 Tax=Propioniciclava sp. TaxID=2038686 RepID=UPI0039E3A051
MSDPRNRGMAPILIGIILIFKGIDIVRMLSAGSAVAWHHYLTLVVIAAVWVGSVAWARKK